MFKNPAHMVQFLSRSREDDPHWVAMVRSARDFLDERKVPKYKIKRNDLLKIVHHPPHEVAGMLMHDLRKAKQSKEKGAGIFSGIWNGISAITDEAAHLVGFDALKDAIGLGWDHIPLSNHEEEVAIALEQSYKNWGERSAMAGSMRRLPEYDTDDLCVWKQKDGELLVTVRGTKMNASDLGNDAQIFAGGEVRSTELQTLLQYLDWTGEHYSLAGHSLGTQFIQNAIKDDEGGQNVDQIYLFNPASSTFQSTSYLKEQANDKRYTWFINQGDLVSKALWQQMNNETLGSDRIHIAPYTWDPLSSHMVGQWVVDDWKPEEKKTDEIKKEDVEWKPPEAQKGDIPMQSLQDAIKKGEVETITEQQDDEEVEAEEAAEQQGEEARHSGWTVNYNK